MDERTRAGQLFMVAVPATGLDNATAAVISRDAPGGVFLLGRSNAGVSAAAQLIASTQRIATVAARGVPLFVAADQEGGQIQVLSGPGFSVMPSAVVQGQWSPELLRAEAARWAGELRSAGINLDLAPVADVLSAQLGTANAPIGQYDRAYSTDPSVAADHVAAFVSGMQSAGVATAVKHFPGLGRVRDNTDTTANVTDNETTPDDPALASFAAGARAGSTFMMTSSATYTNIDGANRGAFSRTMVQGLMRGALGFQGLIMSDDLGMAVEVASVPVGQRAVDFLNAGGDVIVTGDARTVDPMIDSVVNQSHADPQFAAAVAASERRVVETKIARGLLSCTGSSH